MRVRLRACVCLLGHRTQRDPLPFHTHALRMPCACAQGEDRRAGRPASPARQARQAETAAARCSSSGGSSRWWRVSRAAARRRANGSFGDCRASSSRGCSSRRGSSRRGYSLNCRRGSSSSRRGSGGGHAPRVLRQLRHRGRAAGHGGGRLPLLQRVCQQLLMSTL